MLTRIILQLQGNSAAGSVTPDVSVIVVNWNRREMLRGCLHSLANQRGPKFEVIVVDNGSTDGSAEMVSGFAAQAPCPVRLLKNRPSRREVFASGQFGRQHIHLFDHWWLSEQIRRFRHQCLCYSAGEMSLST